MAEDIAIVQHDGKCLVAELSNYEMDICYHHTHEFDDTEGNLDPCAELTDNTVWLVLAQPKSETDSDNNHTGRL